MCAPFQMRILDLLYRLREAMREKANAGVPHLTDARVQVYNFVFINLTFIYKYKPEKISFNHYIFVSFRHIVLL